MVELGLGEGWAKLDGWGLGSGAAECLMAIKVLTKSEVQACVCLWSQSSDMSTVT